MCKKFVSLIRKSLKFAIFFAISALILPATVIFWAHKNQDSVLKTVKKGPIEQETQQEDDFWKKEGPTSISSLPQIEDTDLFKRKREAAASFPKSAGILAKIQRAELIILKKFDAFCKKHGLKYYLHYGTLLGCIRHNGFIPWDDDIDVGMPFEDHEKFKKLLKTEKDMKDFVNTADEIFISKLTFKEFSKDTRVFIDIFPVYPISNKKHFIDLEKKYREYLEKNGTEKTRALYKEYTEKIYNPDGKYLCCGFNYAFGNVEDWICKKDQVFPLKSGKFEGFDFPIPHNWDEILKKLYGDYWEPVKGEYHTLNSDWIKDPEKVELFESVVKKHEYILKSCN